MGVVVVGMDLSENSTLAFREAIREAVWRGASVLVLYVLQMPAYAAVEFGAMEIDLGAIRSAGVTALELHLAEIETGFDGGFPVPVSTEVAIGHTGSRILQAAADHDAELVVLGSRGLGGFRGLMVGSVTTYAVHHLRTQLLVVPADGADEDG